MHVRTWSTVAGVSVMASTFAGCRSFTSPARAKQLDQSGSYWVDYDATRRGAVLTTDSTGNIKMVAEPAPDVAMELTQKFLAKVNYQGVEGEASAELAESIVELGKRTQTVMFLRETLYRLAEMSNNVTIPVGDQLTVFKLIVDAASKLAMAEVESAKAAGKAADAKMLEAQAMQFNALSNLAKSGLIDVEERNDGGVITSIPKDPNDVGAWEKWIREHTITVPETEAPTQPDGEK